MGLAWGNALFIHMYNDTLTTCLIQQTAVCSSRLNTQNMFFKKKKKPQSVIYNNALIFH